MAMMRLRRRAGSVCPVCCVPHFTHPRNTDCVGDQTDTRTSQQSFHATHRLCSVVYLRVVANCLVKVLAAKPGDGHLGVDTF